ncbi:trypsin-like [Pararge aegeria]|uniref:trypsin-like n=1 Tax=Pararge aegeria TaxID=116150 RepID=UPI0019D19FD7|nr:trypsin-like [Pararge aegeria]
MFMFNWEICEAGLRILGGRDALKDEFPFAVRLEEQYTVVTDGKTQVEYHQYCTGAALTPSWILTAAHCNDGDDEISTSKQNKFARYNSYFPKELGHLSPITKVLAHPNYFMYAFTSLRAIYDVALLQTANIKVGRYGKISAIDYMSFVGHEAVVLGFGGTNATPTEKPLQVLKGMLKNCGEEVGNVYGFLCVVPPCGLEATICGGDSGGPVVHASGIFGVNSMSTGNCNEFSHTLYPGDAAAIVSMVSPLIDWISNIISNKTNGRS